MSVLPNTPIQIKLMWINTIVNGKNTLPMNKPHKAIYIAIFIEELLDMYIH